MVVLFGGRCRPLLLPPPPPPPVRPAPRSPSQPLRCRLWTAPRLPLRAPSQLPRQPSTTAPKQPTRPSHPHDDIPLARMSCDTPRGCSCRSGPDSPAFLGRGVTRTSAIPADAKEDAAEDERQNDGLTQFRNSFPARPGERKRGDGTCARRGWRGGAAISERATQGHPMGTQVLAQQRYGVPEQRRPPSKTTLTTHQGFDGKYIQRISAQIGRMQHIFSPVGGRGVFVSGAADQIERPREKSVWGPLLH